MEENKNKTNMQENQNQANQKQKKHWEIYLVLLLLLFISVGFAILTTTLNIVGNTTVKKSTWEVKFTDATEASGTVAESGSTVAELGEVNVTNDTQVDFTSTLNLPGDYYQFDVIVKNAGTINAVLSEIPATNTKLTADQQKYLEYTVKYADGSEITVNDGIRAGEQTTLRVKVSYKKDLAATDLPTTADVKFNSTYGLKYTQAPNTGVSYTHSSAAS